MRVDGRDIPVTGSLLQPLIRRTSDIIRVVLAALWVGVVVAASLITRPEWLALERSVSNIVGFLNPDQSNLVYLVYGMAILALPFAILIELIIGRQWKLLAGYATAGWSRACCYRSPAPDCPRRNGICRYRIGSIPSCRSSSTIRAGSPCSRRC